jgi:phage terminase large subunit-like protein
MTGHIPLSLQGVYPKEKIRAPIQARVVCNSLIDTLEPIIKRKLRFDQWNGVSKDRGHWGWIPRHCLRNGKWEDSYSEKHRTLHVAVDNYWVGQDGSVNSTRGWSSCQFLSYDQELTAFSGSSMHLIVHDELPPSDIYRENRLRVLDVRGQIYTAFTPPDEIGQSRADVGWFFDEVYEKGVTGVPGFESITLHTEDNRILDAEAIHELASKLTEEQREVRLLGRFIHLSGVIFSLFSAHHSWWCFKCERKIVPVDSNCPYCTGNDIDTFTHVMDPFVIPLHWPVIFVIDPHPRKKDMMGWFAITPSDDILQIGELEMDGTADDVAREVFAWEKAHRVQVVRRLMDPNIATETNDKLDRGWTIRRAYDEAGLRCSLALDSVNAGIEEVNTLLRPDRRTRRPRFSVFSTCQRTIIAAGRWAWDEHANPGDKEPKERVRETYKDPMDIWRYMAMDRPSFGGYVRSSDRIIRPHGERGPRGY